jgi:hypothetical protein
VQDAAGKTAAAVFTPGAVTRAPWSSRRRSWRRAPTTCRSRSGATSRSASRARWWWCSRQVELHHRRSVERGGEFAAPFR